MSRHTSHQPASRSRRLITAALYLTAFAACVVACGSALADEITDWNAIAMRAVLDAPGSNQGRILTMMHLAQFDALNSIDPHYAQYSRLPSFLPDAAGASPQAAADQAAYAILSNLIPTRVADFDAALQSRLGAIPDSPVKTAGINLGNAAAARMISLRQNDHSTDVVPYTVGTNPGDWRPTGTAQARAANTQWPYVTPFTLNSGSQFRATNGPPALNSAAFAAAVNEVRNLGSATSTTRTQEQTDIARFWYLAGGTTNATTGLWNRVAQTVSQSHPERSLLDNARLFSLLNMAQHDDFIGSNDDKFHFNLWRPETAIHLADTYNNPDVAADPNWTPLLPAPAFPAYVSNHASLDQASAEVLKYIFGGDNVTFTASSQGFGMPDRTYTSFDQAAEEGGLSRIYAGIHYRFDSVDGLVLGRNVGEWVVSHELTPEPGAAALWVVLAAGALLKRRR